MISWQSVIINSAYFAIRQYVGSGIFDRIQILVFELLNSDISGDDKKKLVRESIKSEYSTIRTMIVDTVIQIVLMKRILPPVFKHQ